MPSAIELLLSLIGVLFFLVVTLLGVIYRSKFNHLKDQQGQQDRRIEDLEGKVDMLDRDNARTFEKVESLTKTLEHYFQELKAEIEKQGTQMSHNLKVYRVDDEKAHKAILDRLDDKLQRQKG